MLVSTSDVIHLVCNFRVWFKYLKTIKRNWLFRMRLQCHKYLQALLDMNFWLWCTQCIYRILTSQQ